MGETAYLSLGSNIGERAANLATAITYLGEVARIQAVSSIYETQPVDLPDQPWFLNCAVSIETTLPPFELLKATLSIEKTMGRLRMRDKGPRKIDIDIVMYSDRVIDVPDLKIPHPAMHVRRFVLQPLAEIAPQAMQPALGKTISELLAVLPQGEAVRRLQPKATK